MKIYKLLPILPFAVSLSLRAQCTNTSLNGIVIYSLSGTVKSGTSAVSYSELGSVTADGKGNLSAGTSNTSTAGAIQTLSVSGTYSISANCSGSATIMTSANTLQLSIQLVSGGGTVLISGLTSGNGFIGDGRIYRAANATGGQCGTGTLEGPFGLILGGGTYVGTTRTANETLAQATFDGKGGFSGSGETTTPTTTGAAFNYTGTYTMTSNCVGTAQLNITGGATLNYVVARINDGNVLFQETDANTTLNGSAVPQGNSDIVPQIAFGGGWYTALYFTNYTSSSVTFLVSFFLDTGLPMSIPGLGTTQQVVLPPGSTTILEALDQGSLTEGYATFSIPAGVTGYSVFRQTSAGIAPQEGLVEFKDATATAIQMTWDDTNYTTSIAIVNPSTVQTTVTITVWDNNGNLIGTSPLVLAAGTKTENIMSSYPGLSKMVGLRGSALFSVTGGNVSVVGFRFNGAAFTNVPTSQP